MHSRWDWSTKSKASSPSFLQVGRALTLNRTLRQWVDLGDVSGWTCLTRPTTCPEPEASLGMWLNLHDCSGGNGVLTSISNAEDGIAVRGQGTRLRSEWRVLALCFEHKLRGRVASDVCV